MNDFDLVHFFHENSKRRMNMVLPDPDVEKRPPSFKVYGNSSVISLSSQKLNNDLTSIEKCIVDRNSCREFLNKPMEKEVLSKILYYGYGITSSTYLENVEHFRRSCPSGGALYPCELYPVVFNVGGLDNGIYHYSPIDNTLDFLKKGNFIHDIIYLFMQQYAIIDSSICVIISGILERTMWKYGARGYRYLLLEAGHLAQNMCLVATSNGLGTLPLGGFEDDALADFLNLDNTYEPILYGVVFGHRSNKNNC